MKWRSRKVYIGGAVAVVLALVALGALSGSDDDITTVQAELAYLDEIAEVVSASGRVEPQTRVDITSEVSAQIIDTYVREGDRVARGDALLLLDTVQLRTDEAQARYSMEELTARAKAARAGYERDKLAYERQSALHKQGLASETEYTNSRFALDGSMATWEAMRAQVNTAAARLEKARDNLRKTRIVAPMAGVVTYLGAEVGEIAQAQTAFTQGKTLLTIADLSVFEVEVDVDETEISKVYFDQAADIRVDAFHDTTFEGRVVEIGNSARVLGEGTEDYTTSFRVKVRFADSGLPMRPGMSATVDITTSREDEALLIPYAAVVTRKIDLDSVRSAEQSKPDSDEVVAAEPEPTPAQADTTGETGGKRKKSKKEKKTGVFVCRDGKAHFVEVTTGIADEQSIVALTGIVPGDTVISGSFQTLRSLSDGEAVQIEESSLEDMGSEES